MGDADQHSALGAQHLALTRRARPALGAESFPSSVCQLRRSGLGADLAQAAATRPSDFETTLWATTSTSPSARPCGRSAVSDQLAEVVAGLDLGQPLERGRRQHRFSPGYAACWPSIPRVWAAPPWVRRASASERLEVLGRVHVERERRDVDDLVADPADLASASWRSRLPGPKDGVERVWRASAAARWSRCRGGRARSAPTAGPPGRAISSSSSAGSSIGQSPGTSSSPVESRRRALGGRRGAAASLCPRLVLVEHVAHRAPGDLLGAVVGGDDDHDPSTERVRRSATSTSENIASASARRGAGSSPALEALLGVVEALDWQDREGRIGRTLARVRARARSERLLGQAPASVGIGHQDVGLQHRQRVRRSSATSPSITPA